jgi:EAL and modified HD-GYP domain-containing signal transduction protein
VPIFDTEFDVFAYDLVSASATPEAITSSDPERTCARLIADGSLLFDWATLTSNKRALVTVTREALLERSIQLLSSDVTIVQLPGSMELDPEVTAACEELQEAGYGLAIDGCNHDPAWDRLLRPSDLVKIDLAHHPRERDRILAERFADCPARLVATHVETREALQEAEELGFKLFQGFFFTKPVIVSTKQIPSSKLSLLEILRELYRPDVDFEKIERAVRNDVGLCYKLLRYINSASHGIRHEIKSVHRALVQLGEREIKRWISLCVVTMTAVDRPPEMVLLALVRAHFCEAVAPAFGLREQAGDLFLMGMLSMIDALLGRPMAELLEPLPLNEQIKSTLIEGEGEFQPVYRLCRAMERGQWPELDDAVYLTHRADISQAYLDALKWGSDLLAIV